VKNSVFDHAWATVTIDEFHEFRTQTIRYFGMLGLHGSTHFIIGATATPLFNTFQVPGNFALRAGKRGLTGMVSLQDVSNLGRLLRIPAFCGLHGDLFDKQMVADIEKAGRDLTDEQKLLMRNNLGHSEGKAGEEDPVRKATTVAIQGVRKRFGNRIIRRTPRSLRDDGLPINNELPDCQEVRAYVELQGSEKAILDQYVRKLVST
jgi:hypothetical protein